MSFPTFNGVAGEDAQELLDNLEIACLVTEHDDDATRLRVFPLFMETKANAWFNTLLPANRGDWVGLRVLFLAKFAGGGETSENLWDKVCELRKDKCHIGEDKVTLLGHRVSKGGIEVDPEKVEALCNLPPPRNVKEVTSFIQKIKYMSRFIHLSSELLHPLQQIAKSIEFVWTPLLDQYFGSIKEILASLPTIMPPCFKSAFYVNPSVGCETVGATLLQQDPIGSRMRPVYFAIRVLLNVEKRYSEVEQAMLALMFAVRKFRSYLLHQPFVVLTIEPMFSWVSKHMSLSSRISKWMMELQEYEYTFKVEDSVRAQLVDLLTYRAHEKKIEIPKVKVPPPPPKVIPNAYTLFFDGAFRRGVGKARGGLVLLDPEGKVDMEETLVLTDSMSNNEAEFDILILGLKACISRGIKRLMVKGDALLVVKQVMGVRACKSEKLKGKVRVIRSLLSQFSDVQLYHIPQKENQQANDLAQRAVKEVITLAAASLKPPRFEGLEALAPIASYILEGEFPPGLTSLQ
ncbi:hypothetical protein L7F22_051324 [Adiantum nelumboides]|nr:hypothetical protein [Adiantum nelumboides]MCO5597248.1 hypothetical protein [Adiantum nelumboides]